MEETVYIPGFHMARKVADGGCGEIYEAEQEATRQRVAIKILHPRHYGNTSEAKRLVREGELGMRLQGEPHIVKMFSVGRVKRPGLTIPYIVMEFVSGRSLRVILRERGKLSDGEVLEIAIAMTRALGYMHQHNIFHKDVKPDNIMMAGVRAIKLLDLGFAETAASVRLSSFFKRPLEGSPAYLAPELIHTKRPSFATDIYSLGCTLYELAAGFLPFSGTSDREVIALQANVRIPAPAFMAANPSITYPTQALILKAVEKRPERRFQSADELWLALCRHPGMRRQMSF